MTAPSLLEDQRRHLASLLEAIQRCVYFLDASTRDVSWPLTGQYLDLHKKDNALHFNTLRELTPDLFVAARRFVDYCAGTLNVNPLTVDFEAEFMQITSTPLRCQG